MGHAVVVGGGLAGSLLAVLLARRGQRVDVFERFPETTDERGQRRPALNLTLCERGLQALDAVGLKQAVLDLAVPARGRLVHTPDGVRTYQPYGNHGEAIYSISRSDLNECLVQFARRERGVRFHFDEKCVHVNLAEKSVRFENSRTGKVTDVRAERIFGADGAYSTVRSHLQRTEHFNYSQQYFKLGGYKSFWVPPTANGGPALEGEVLHIWPRGARMMMGFPNRDGSGMLSLLLPLRGEDSFESLTTPARVEEFFRRHFPAALEKVPSLVEKFLAGPANSLLTIRCDPWSYRDTVLLVGDAAHAVLPSYGQGANSAFEDCSALDECMREHGDDWSAIFEQFERRRRPDMDVMADLCVEHFVELCDLVADPAFLKRREIERRLEDLHPNLYRPLYSMVSFTSMRYSEAFELEKRQRSAVDRILALPDVENRLASPEVIRILAESTGGQPVAVPTRADAAHDSDLLFRTALGFWNAKVILSGVELGLFEALSHGPRTAEAIARDLGLHQRGARDYLDALTALGVLVRSNDVYANSTAAQAFLNPESDGYIGGALELANSRLYPVWGKLTEALRTGLPQNEAKVEEDYYANLTSDPERLRKFLRGMTGLSKMAARALTTAFDWREYSSFADLGGAQGVLPVELALAHEHLQGVNFDLPPVQTVFEDYARSFGLESRLKFQAGDFFSDPLPATDVFVMGHVLHNWNLDEKRTLIRKAYDALPRRGALIVYEALIDDERNRSAFGLLMSLNMLLVTKGGFVFTGADCQGWMREAGFAHTYVKHLHGPDWMVVGLKGHEG